MRARIGPITVWPSRRSAEEQNQCNRDINHGDPHQNQPPPGMVQIMESAYARPDPKWADQSECKQADREGPTAETHHQGRGNGA